MVKRGSGQIIRQPKPKPEEKPKPEPKRVSEESWLAFGVQYGATPASVLHLMLRIGRRSIKRLAMDTTFGGPCPETLKRVLG